MQKSEVKDLTVGSPMKLILSFAVPMLLGFLFQQFYNMVDTIIVGQYLGEDALAAVFQCLLGGLPAGCGPGRAPPGNGWS